MPYLEFERHLRPVGPGIVTIGSAPEAGWRILGRELAPIHVLVAPQGDGRALVVRGSTSAAVAINGIEINEERRSIGYGDAIRIGSAEFVYRQTARQEPSGEAYLRDMRRARVFKLGEGATIGRDPKCAVLLPEASVSRMHAEVRTVDGQYEVKAIGNAYVALNREPLLAPARLKEGDELSIGDTVLRFTTERPNNVQSAEGSRTFANPRAAAMATVFVGAVEMRERMQRGRQRKLAAMIGAAVTMGSLIALLVAK